MAQAIAADIKALQASIGAPSAAAIYAASVDTGRTPATEKLGVVVNADVSPSSKILVGWGSVTDADENSPEMDNVAFRAVAGNGQFMLYVASSNSNRLRGVFKIHYMIG